MFFICILHGVEHMGLTHYVHELSVNIWFISYKKKQLPNIMQFL